MRDEMFADTNIFIYAISGVDKVKQKKCVSLLEKASRGGVRLWMTEWVISELVWFLSGQKWKWIDVKRTVEAILETRGIEVRKRDWVASVLARSLKTSDFVDVVNMDLVKEEGLGRGYSYDRGLDRFEGFKRVEP